MRVHLLLWAILALSFAASVWILMPAASTEERARIVMVEAEAGAGIWARTMGHNSARTLCQRAVGAEVSCSVSTPRGIYSLRCLPASDPAQRCRLQAVAPVEGSGP